MVPLPVEDGTPITTANQVKAIATKLQKSNIGTNKSDVASGVSVSPTTLQTIGTNTCVPGTGTARDWLSDGFDIFAYNLDRNAAVNVSAFASADLKASDRVTLYRFMLYKDIFDGSGAVQATCGAGIQLALRTRNASATINTTLPFLAANAQLGLADVEYRIKTFGMSGPGVISAIPIASQVGQFNADSYASLLRTLDKLQSNLNSNSAADAINITPRLVEVVNDAPRVGFDQQIAVQAFALGQVAAGRKCSDAIARVPNRNTTTDAYVTEVYSSMSGRDSCKDNSQPAAAIRASVSQTLKALKIKVD